MLSLGWSEITIIIVLVIIVVGPKEIPNLLKQLGYVSKKLKSLSRDFNTSLNNIVKTLLKNSGIKKIYDCGLCTYELNDLFFSYRRDGNTGRTATMIWIV